MREAVRRRIGTVAFAAALIGFSLSGRADGPGPVLHEFIPVDPREDVELSATTSDGRMPAVLDTPSGLVPAPDTSRPPSPTEKAYGGVPAGSNAESAFRPDRDTRRPTVASYDDPFSPATAPYKRLRAYDMVNADFSLAVADASLRPVEEGGSVRANEDQFYGDMTVDLLPGEPVRIPTVGPGARVLRRSTVPQVNVELLHDSADNWFVRSAIRTRVRLIEEVAIAKAAFGGPIAQGARKMPGMLPPLPPNVARAASEVIQALKLSERDPLADNLSQLVSYFRSFEPSDEPPRGRENIYLDLALSRKGVCRHRAYAFLITAQALGIPTRMVVNEAHAWVEVYDGTLWRRIDLGGAATHLQEERSNEQVPAHKAPDDPFPWPQNADSGQALAQREHQQRGSNPRTPSQAPAASGSGTGSMGSVPAPEGSTAAAEAMPVDEPTPSGPTSTLSVTTSEARVMRGAPLSVQGAVQTTLGPCHHVRVDVALSDVRAARQIVIGSLSTDEDGRFHGAVVVPLTVPVGDYELIVTTPGDPRCGAGQSGP